MHRSTQWRLSHRSTQWRFSHKRAHQALLLEQAAGCRMRIDEVTADDRLIGVHTPVADGVELAGARRGAPLDLAIAAGSELEMHEHGLHLRLAPLRLALHAGRSYPLRLTFARSGVVDTILSVDFPRFV